MALAITLSGVRNRIITSIFGRRIGFLFGNSSDTGNHFLGGPADWLVPVNTITTASTAADQIPSYGIAIMSGNSTSGTTYHSPTTPVPGGRLLIISGTTQAVTIQLNGSTGTTAVVGYLLANVAGSSGLTTATALSLPKFGTHAELVGLSTAIWFVRSNWGTSATTYGSSAV